jgi:hypothetical protein
MASQCGKDNRLNYESIEAAEEAGIKKGGGRNKKEY